MNKSIPQIISAAIFVAVAVTLANPMHLWMPSMAHMTLLGAAVVVFGIFAMFVFTERVEDERDQLHTLQAGHAAFFAGGAVLLAGIVVQSLYDSLDPWLVYALLAMVVAKVSLRVWGSHYQ